MTPTEPTGERRFPLGQIVATPGALEALGSGESERSANLYALLARHVSGDWGDLTEEDRRENDLSIERRLRILSSYDVEGTKVWIITEADRSSTCVLLPEEY